MLIFKRIKTLFKPKPKLLDGNTYDLRDWEYYLEVNRTFKNYTANLHITSWGKCPSQGDYLILRYSSTEATRYQVERAHVVHGLDIGCIAMWKADIVFAPRTF